MQVRDGDRSRGEVVEGRKKRSSGGSQDRGGEGGSKVGWERQRERYVDGSKNR